MRSQSFELDQRWLTYDEPSSENFFSTILREPELTDSPMFSPAQDDHSAATVANKGKKRQRRTAKSCQACIQSHYSCDRSRPTCVNCFRRGKVCAYADDAAPATPASSSSSSSSSSPSAAPSSTSPLILGRPSFEMKPYGTMTATESSLVTQLQQLVIQQQATLTQQNLFIQNMMGTLYSQQGPAGPSMATTTTTTTHGQAPLPIDQQGRPQSTPAGERQSSTSSTQPGVEAVPEWRRGAFIEKLLSLLCYTKQRWQYQPERSREIIRSTIQSFIENNPDQFMLSVELDARGIPHLIGMTQQYLSVLKAENLSTDSDLIIHRLLTGHESIFCTSARTAQINFILPAAYYNPSGCHRLIFEKSNQFMYRGELRSGQFWLGLFYDHQDHIAACCGFTELQDTILPIAKAYLVTDSCRHCSKLPALPPGIQVPAFRSPDPYHLETRERLIEQIRHTTPIPTPTPLSTPLSTPIPTPSRCSCLPLLCNCSSGVDREPITPAGFSGHEEFFSPPLS